MTTPQEQAALSPIGRDTPRVDGPVKVSGVAQYTSDFHFPGQLYAVPVEATIANGRLLKLDTSAAEKMPGVRAIFHRENIGKIFRSVIGTGFEGLCDERRPPFEDDVIRYYGQYIALAVGYVEGQSCRFCSTTYSKETPNVELNQGRRRFRCSLLRRSACVIASTANGVTLTRLSQARLSIRHMSRQLGHNTRTSFGDCDLGGPLDVDVYESSGCGQSRASWRRCSASKENVRVVSKFVGSGFGSKLWPWTHCPLAVAAARQIGKPVKLVVSRKMMFQSVGHRARTQQRVRLGATPDGKLVSLQHDYVYQRSMLDDHHEDCGEATPFQYSVPNLRVTFGRAKQNVGATTDMRGPGRVPGLYATESAMNELADQLKIDPLRLRILNEPKIDESLGIPFSSRHLVECFELGAEKFGWSGAPGLVQ